MAGNFRITIGLASKAQNKTGFITFISLDLITSARTRRLTTNEKFLNFIDREIGKKKGRESDHESSSEYLINLGYFPAFTFEIFCSPPSPPLPPFLSICCSPNVWQDTKASLTNSIEKAEKADYSRSWGILKVICSLPPLTIFCRKRWPVIVIVTAVSNDCRLESGRIEGRRTNSFCYPRVTDSTKSSRLAFSLLSSSP